MEETENNITLLSEEVNQLRKALEGFRPGDKKIKVPAKITLATFGPSDSGSTVLPKNVHEITYNNALNLFNKGKHRDAIKTFRMAIKSSSKGKHRDDCQYWIGESYRLIGEYAKAIESFEDVFSYVKSDKLDDAQMRIANTYSQMGDDSQAIEEYQKLISLYPNSNLVKDAKVQIERLER